METTTTKHSPSLTVIEGGRKELELKTLRSIFDFDPDQLLSGLTAMRDANQKKPKLHLVGSD